MKLGNLLIPALVLGLAAFLLFFVVMRWNTWHSSAHDEKTDDAYLHANIVPLSTRATETLRRLDVNDFQRVRAGDLIAELDDTDYRAQLEQAESGLAQAEAAKDTNQVQKRVQQAKIQQAQHQLEEAQDAERVTMANAGAAEADAVRADKERERQQALYAENAATRQTLEKAVDEDEKARNALASARANVAKAADAVGAARRVVAESQAELALLVSKDRQLDADIRERAAAIQTAKVQFDFTRIYAPADGVLGERKVFPGQLLSPGMEVISLTEGDVWVEANFEETQLANMLPGDRADIRIDALPAHVFHGKVLEISPSSGSQSSLFPPDNATGNFTKIVQRIPVKLSVEASKDERDRLRSGFSASVSVFPSGHGSRVAKMQQ